MDGFLMYRDYAQYFGFLSKEEKADLLDAIFGYAFEGKEEEGLSQSAKIVFAVIKNQFDRDREKYEQKCEKNRKNASLGGRPAKNTREDKEKEKKASSFEADDFFEAAVLASLKK